ncbi:glycine--tRNA ligase [Humisphaera borealis]|uniref:Glycine--tRNA ligase n=1 Tax=Humisphaera borealis TaxID=2807512 RepID=A0A7M2X1Y0_9BACT|nr:glycine--tRNA ligase [Humisphaera borealis]QOV91674.1 glycine--tRNA ligase [Humisphaera borealis]
MSDVKAESSVMGQIVALCKRRGFVYPASEIYGGIRGFWDYGPLGILLKNNIRDWWWRQMVLCPPIGPDGHPVDMVGLDSAIIQHPRTWEASGHVAGFNDPMVDDIGVSRYRADHMFGMFAAGADVPVATCVASSLGEAAEMIATDKKLQKLFGLRNVEVAERNEAGVTAVKASYKGQPFEGTILCLYPPAREGLFPTYPSPSTGEVGKLTDPRAFNLMLDTYPGPIRDEANKAYLRPETAQGIFLNFKNVVDTTRVKVPFGVAQVGKSFRNEVTPRNFIFRSREFEQMEMEWFCPPDDALMWYDFWKHERMKWWESLGVAKENLKFRDHDKDELSHYSKATVDIEYKYPFTAPDFGELEGIAHRGSYDLTQHQEHSKQKLDYFDQELQLRLKEQGIAPEEIKARSRYIPNVIEPASGLTRAVLVLLCEAYTVDAARPSGVYLKFKPKFAPIKAGIYPLVAKDGMPEVAEKLYLDLRNRFTCEYDPKQAIGKRYARMDEIGTPFCVTVDGDTLKDQTVTIRHRDTLQQERIGLDKVKDFLRDRVEE